jgi:hypothetical protein
MHEICTKKLVGNNVYLYQTSYTDFIICELKLFKYFHLVGSETFSRTRIRNKSFRIRAALDPKLI